MNIKSIIKPNKISQQVGNWYVLDEEFMFELSWIKEQVERCMKRTFPVPVVFCEPYDASCLAGELNREEDECLLFRYAAGVYMKDAGVIFIFHYDDLLSVLLTVFHELRHVEQEEIDELKNHFITDKALPYKNRVLEKDANHYAEKMLGRFFANNKE